jgi:endonuclease YncB( thermonuclease family)
MTRPALSPQGQLTHDLGAWRERELPPSLSQPSTWHEFGSPQTEVAASNRSRNQPQENSTNAEAPRSAPPRARAAASCDRSPTEDAVQSVSAAGELTLTSGRTVKLLDIRFPADDAGLARALAWLRSLAGRRVAAAPVGSTDRWGRVAADVVLLDDGGPIDVAELLVGEGFAIVDAGERDALCRPPLLAREAQARSRRIGLWADARFRPVPAHDIERLRALIGQFALVEGRVRGVGERRERTYLNFGPDWKTDFTITIPKRTWAVLRERGVSAASLKGARVRARGIIEEWQGVALEITAADMLEVPGDDHARPPGTRP